MHIILLNILTQKDTVDNLLYLILAELIVVAGFKYKNVYIYATK